MLIVVVAVMNYCGIRVSATIQLGVAAVLAGLLAAATMTALPHADLARLTPFAPFGWASVGTAAALLVWAFAGWEVVSSLSADYRDPGRDIPRATAVAVVVIGVLYLGVAFATVAVLGANPGPAPLSDLLAIGLGEWARPATTLVAVLLSVGAMNAYFAGSARLGAALGRDGSLPTWLAHGSTPGAVPRRALLVVTGGSLGTLLVIAVLGARPESTLLLFTGAFTTVYVVGTAAALRVLPRGSAAWRCAEVSFVATLGLLGLTGRHMFASLLIAAGALAWTALTSRAAEPAVGCPAGSTP